MAEIEGCTVRGWLFRGLIATPFCLLVLPLGIVVATAFDASSAVVFPPTELPGLRGVLVGLVLLPLLVPGVVIGVSLLTFFSVFGLQQSYLALVLAHSLWAAPPTFSVMQSSSARFDWRRHEAARDLGASRLVAFRAVVVPEVRTGLVVAALVAFIVSLRGFVMALFLSGPDTRTVPVQAWNSLGQSPNPLVSVVPTILLAAVVLLVLVGAALAGLERLATDAPSGRRRPCRWVREVVSHLIDPIGKTLESYCLL